MPRVATSVPESRVPTVSPSPAPSSVPETRVPAASPTILSTVPELVEARLAATVSGIDLVFEPGRGSAGTVWLCKDADVNQ